MNAEALEIYRVVASILSRPVRVVSDAGLDAIQRRYCACKYCEIEREFGFHLIFDI